MGDDNNNDDDNKNNKSTKKKNGDDNDDGNVQMLYRRTPYRMRTNLEEFLKILQDKCLNREFLTKKRVRINSKRARDYMAGYLLLFVKVLITTHQRKNPLNYMPGYL